ncbi:hypothetical protein [Mycobacterium lacus]|uniref:Uncharacterized protein n=1 Tax=Mycobacterium lacus TaxID=169765 RepID=A0A7I7NGC2_9MYCO|nr:hypothetical protein [Mycobacterium lacus]BBX95665.1 hypothetical protein MLAC_09590 [Mycobacterium lacus]
MAAAKQHLDGARRTRAIELDARTVAALNVCTRLATVVKGDIREHDGVPPRVLLDYARQEVEARLVDTAYADLPAPPGATWVGSWGPRRCVGGARPRTKPRAGSADVFGGDSISAQTWWAPT